MIKRFNQYNEDFFLPTDENIPTAEEFISLYPRSIMQKEQLIEFAKLHVRAALKAAVENVEKEYPNPSINKGIILSSYPESNIQ